MWFAPAPLRGFSGPYAYSGRVCGSSFVSRPHRTSVLVFLAVLIRQPLRSCDEGAVGSSAGYSVDVVLGFKSHRWLLPSWWRRPNTTLHEPLPSLAGLIARADLWSWWCNNLGKICLRLPSLVVAIASQLPFSQALDQAGHLRLLGDGASVTAEQIRAALVSCMTEQSLKSFTPLTDGWCARMALAMLGPRVQLLCDQL